MWLLSAPASAQRFRGGVDLVSLTITVTEGTRYVTDLEEADFEVSVKGENSLVKFLSVRSKGQSLLNSVNILVELILR